MGWEVVQVEIRISSGENNVYQEHGVEKGFARTVFGDVALDGGILFWSCS